MGALRVPLLAYVLLLVVGVVGVFAASRTIVKHYEQHIDRQVNQRIVERLDADKVCRDQAQGPNVQACRALIDRVVSAATARQEHAMAVRLFRTLTVGEIRELGLQGKRGRPGRTEIIRTTRTIVIRRPGKTTVVTKTVTTPGSPGAPGAQGPPGPPGPPAPTPTPGQPGNGSGPPPRPHSGPAGVTPPSVTPTPGSGPGNQGNPPGPSGNPSRGPCPPANPHC